ncbi:hypothetical protein [Mycoplasma suis]|uniref:Uncharacterized protein n=1 Tax=Mycoplasma suis (strain Illinois) TaxID=768700 RepID=F0QQE0_MYCSL|nr:hypothetical protein [Mycoplasma suis]ADX97710.1 hypothetical protein MSU_0166 [Mycoplasma suis str. Illinois]
MPLNLKGWYLPFAVGFTGVAAGGGFSLARLLSSKYEGKSYRKNSMNSLVVVPATKNNVDNINLAPKSSEDATSEKSKQLSSFFRKKDDSGEKLKDFSEVVPSFEDLIKQIRERKGPIFSLGPEKVIAEFVYRDLKNGIPLTCEQWFSSSWHDREVLGDNDCNNLLIKEVLGDNGGSGNQSIKWFRAGQDDFEDIFNYSFPKNLRKGNFEIENQNWKLGEEWDCVTNWDKSGRVVISCHKNQEKIEFGEKQ